jgi:chromosome segregation ATPase
LYGAFVWARRALNSQKRRFPARAVDEEATSLQEELDGKTKKLDKLRRRLKQAQSEIKDLHDEFQVEKDDYLETIRSAAAPSKLSPLASHISPIRSPLSALRSPLSALRSPRPDLARSLRVAHARARRRSSERDLKLYMAIAMKLAGSELLQRWAECATSYAMRLDLSGPLLDSLNGKR